MVGEEDLERKKNEEVEEEDGGVCCCSVGEYRWFFFMKQTMHMSCTQCITQINKSITHTPTKILYKHRPLFYIYFSTTPTSPFNQPPTENSTFNTISSVHNPTMENIDTAAI